MRNQGTLSQSYPLAAAVPQGAVLSPTLFNVINNLFNGCLGNVEMSLYADDTALWIVGQDIDKCGQIIQEAIESLEQWSHIWGLLISPSKTVAMIFTRKRKFN